VELRGRQPELDLIASVLDDARESRARSLLLLGEPGIGKTALLEALVQAASGFTVLRAAGAVAERDFPYAGLLALLRPLRDELAGLPAVQREALEAVLRGEGGKTERFVVAVATLGLIASVAERAPVLAVVDDLQWLDEPTADALAFTARRLAADAVATVLTARPQGAGELGRVADVVHEVPPLDAAAAAAVLGEAAPTLDAGARARLLEASHGNPLALHELPRLLTAAQRAGAEPLPPAPIAGEAVERAFASSAATLREETRLALAVAALLEEDAVSDLRVALGRLSLSFADLEPAERDGLITLAPGRVGFRHPLVRAAVLGAAGESGRRRAHLALAEALPHGERRALHLAEAAVGPDGRAAQELVDAAAGVPAVTAAALLTRAAALTADDEERAATLVAAAEQAFLAGRLDDARSLTASALELDPPGRTRGTALVVQGRIARFTRPPGEACALLGEGAELLGADDPGAAVAALGDAFFASFPAGDPSLTRSLADRLRDAAGDDPAARPLVSVAAGIAAMMRGDGDEGLTLLDEVLEATRDADAVEPPELALVAALWHSDFGRAAAEAAAAIGRARRSGALGVLPRVLQFAAFADARLARFDAAYAAASEGADLADELGQPVILCDCLNTLAGLEVRMGLHDRCAEHARRAIELSRELDLPWFGSHATFHLALSELAGGRAERTIELLEPVHALNRRRGVVDASEYGYAELVEAYVRVGDEATAVARLAELEALVAQVPRPYDRALATRSAAMVASDEEAPALFERSLAEHTDEMPFERGRTHLLFGERLRRMGERRRARAELEAAMELFLPLGADGWVERCRRELVASGARLRRIDAESRGELTPQELQVALQVAAGLSNREIAQTLFLSPKTVEFHLTRIYRKLGLHARAELIERFRDEPGA
jgi:DNA-binding CsgD family transcriptional regulator